MLTEVLLSCTEHAVFFLFGSVCFLRAKMKHYPANKQSVHVFSVGQQVQIASSAHKSPKLLQHEPAFFS